MQEFIIRCSLSGDILQVITRNNLPELSELQYVSFVDFLHPDSIEAGVQFLTDIQYPGRAENRFLYMYLNNSKKAYSCSGVSLSGQLFISGLETANDQIFLQTSKSVSILEENLKPEMEAAASGYEEMFEELSRLNNELINAKRELIRKNKELERFQTLLKKGMPGI